MIAIFFVCAFVAVNGLPAEPEADPVIRKLDEMRYHYMPDADGKVHLVDTWVKVSDLKNSARFDPDRQNVYHLFTRRNPTLSQPMVLNGAIASNFNPSRRTVVIVHGWTGNITVPVNRVLIPAFLQAEDVNVIGVDWRFGAMVSYVEAVLNFVRSGQAVARFITQLNQRTGARLSMYHIVGHSLGGHKIGIIGRNLNRQVAYMTTLDPPSAGFLTSSNRFAANDAIYTEAFHTSSVGFVDRIADSDFYPNGGVDMPGCGGSIWCDHERCIYYMGESVISGGFNSRRCPNLIQAWAGLCWQSGVPMGGLRPKTGTSGIFYLQTNGSPPFSRG